MLFFWGLKYKAVSIGGVNIVIATVYNNLLSKYNDHAVVAQSIGNDSKESLFIRSPWI
jgi:hypothetical protein